eukprot:7386347-Prymnesium_polylepis.1
MTPVLNSDVGPQSKKCPPVTSVSFCRLRICSMSRMLTKILPNVVTFITIETSKRDFRKPGNKIGLRSLMKSGFGPVSWVVCTTSSLPSTPPSQPKETTSWEINSATITRVACCSHMALVTIARVARCWSVRSLRLWRYGHVAISIPHLPETAGLAIMTFN